MQPPLRSGDPPYNACEARVVLACGTLKDCGNFLERGSMQLSRLLHLLGALVLLATLVLVGRMATTEWQFVRLASQSLRLLEPLGRGLLAAEMVSRERGPTNAALGDVLPLPATRREALEQARRRTDEAFEALLETLANAPTVAPGNVALVLEVQGAQTALAKARAVVEQTLAVPAEQRPAAAIRDAVRGMVAVVPRLAPVTTALASGAQQAYPGMGDDVQGAHLAAELREYAGLLGSHFTAGLAKAQPFSQDERQAIYETRGRILQLQSLVARRLQLPDESEAVQNAWGAVQERYFGAAQALLASVLAQGAGDGHYGLSAAEFAARYVPDMNPIVALRDALLEQARERARLEHRRAVGVLVWALAGAGMLLLVLGGALYMVQHRVLRPLAGTTLALRALAINDLNAPLPARSVQDEMSEIIGAVRSLQIQTQRRQELERERESLIEKLTAQSETDYLTGLPNRRAFMSAAQAALSNALRYKYDVAVVVVDIDWFKQLNDSLGHAAGDQALLAVAEVLRTNLRGGDLAARLGGEEFVVLLSHCDQALGLHWAQRLCERIAQAPVLGLLDADVRITASLGVASAGQAGHVLDALLAAADAAMYQAKRTGRNRVAGNA